MSVSVKICGISDSVSLEVACEAGADFLGLVFFSKSPRNLSIKSAKTLRNLIPSNSQCKIVSLVVDQSDDFIEEMVQEINPDFIQLHGDHSIKRVSSLRSCLKKPLIKALSVSCEREVQQGLDYLLPGQVADMILFDAKPTKSSTLPGGNGLQFDWRILSPVSGKVPFALAGGLNPDNVANAVHCTGATMVDVSSGVERAPGKKDHDLIRLFIRNAKEAGLVKKTNFATLEKFYDKNGR